MCNKHKSTYTPHTYTYAVCVCMCVCGLPFYSTIVRWMDGCGKERIHSNTFTQSHMFCMCVYGMCITISFYIAICHFIVIGVV